MTDEQVMKKFAQSVILAMTSKHMDQEDLDSDDGTQFINELVDWTNQFLDELELETDWNFVTELNKVIGTVTIPAQTFPLPAGTRKLAVREHRPLHIKQDGVPVSTWDIVRPAMISSDSRDGYPLRSRVTYVGKNVVFSRDLDDTEIGGEVVADVVNKIPRLVYDPDVPADNNLEVLDLIEPRQLLVFGVAKNATLPDFVRGKISPSLVQKYTDVLGKAVAENEATGTGDTYEGEDNSGYGGVYL